MRGLQNSSLTAPQKMVSGDNMDEKVRMTFVNRCQILLSKFQLDLSLKDDASWNKALKQHQIKATTALV